MRAELPYLAAGGVSLIGGAIRENGWPSNSLRSILGTIVLVVVASTATNTRFAPLVRAIGLLLLVTSIMAAVRAAQKKGK